MLMDCARWFHRTVEILAEEKPWPPDWWHHAMRTVLVPVEWRSVIIVSYRPVPVPVAQGLRRFGCLGPVCFWSRVLPGLLLVLSCGLWMSAANAATDEVAQELVEYKTVQGQVSGVSATFVAVEYDRDAKSGEVFEMAFPVDDAAKLERIKRLQELKLGDTVLIEYRETMLKDEQGEYAPAKRVATKIALLRTAPAEALSSSGEAE